MASRQKIYVVYAGTVKEGCIAVYESSKLSKAEEFAHSLRKSDQYDKVYIETEYPRYSTKRDCD